MTEHVAERALNPAHRSAPIGLGSALFLTVLVVAALCALAFWPAKAWAPPHRPGIAAPVVFDEFVDEGSAAPAAASEGSSAPH
jgi:hypothetical protein